MVDDAEFAREGLADDEVSAWVEGFAKFVWFGELAIEDDEVVDIVCAGFAVGFVLGWGDDIEA